MFLAMAEVIDTLEIAHELRQARVPEPQADVIARQFKRRYEADRQELVTRRYLGIALQHQSADLEKSLIPLRQARLGLVVGVAGVGGGDD
jgi:hypothetical protein